MSEPIFMCKYCGADYADNPHPMISCIRNLAAQRDYEVRRSEAAEAERDALRADAALVQKHRLGGCVLVPVSRELLSKDWSKQPLFIRIDDNGDGTHSMTLRESTAALAVQP